jgi:uncharacterized protein
MPAMKTPGVYVVEKSAFPNSVVEVATAVPAFIGYTAKAENGDKSLVKKPWRISSLAEYETYYGGAPTPKFNIADAPKLADADFKIRAATVTGKDQGKTVTQDNDKFILYYSMKLFFQNGGGPCYIVSVGHYDDEAKLEESGGEQGAGYGEIKASDLMGGIAPLTKEQEPTMVVIPEAVSLKQMKECIAVQQASLAHCGAKMRNRVSILDIYDGYKDRQDEDGDCIAAFRDQLGINYLDFATAYYPWVNSTIIQEADISFNYLSTTGKAELQKMLSKELKVGITDDLPKEEAAAEDSAAAPADGDEAAAPAPTTGGDKLTKEGQAIADQRTAYGEEIKKIIDFNEDFKVARALPENAKKTDGEIEAALMMKRSLLHKTLVAISPLYVQVIKSISAKLNLLPPAAAMAGVYTAVDNSRGVWKAPANVSLASVSSPAVSITHDDQEDLNVTTQGKSINAIRSFIGEGTLVWGARTLDGNSLDWRYISVRRTMIMMEESIKLGTKAYVFEANNAQTWITIKSMIRNFLIGIWKRGGLAGSSPDDAFSIYVGLGETMTPEDILEGILRVSVLVAVTRPAEFIEITFTQQMQKS